MVSVNDVEVVTRFLSVVWRVFENVVVVVKEVVVVVVVEVADAISFSLIPLAGFSIFMGKNIRNTRRRAENITVHRLNIIVNLVDVVILVLLFFINYLLAV